jgi:hypothetical protein
MFITRQKVVLMIRKFTIMFGIILVLFSMSVLADNNQTQNCWSYSDETACTDASCFWQTSGVGGSNNWCEGVSCYLGDGTNSTYCETSLNSTYGLSCSWEKYGTSFCDPTNEGDVLGDNCADFTTNQECYDTFWCVWNETSSACEQPSGATGDPGSYANPSCGVLSNDSVCTNISGCSWDSVENVCSGHATAGAGISCVDLNKTLEGTNQTLCSDATFLSTCCQWNGTTCGVSYQQDCYNDIPALPIGATYCEDFNVFKNQTLCENIASSPWYMPCKFNKSGNEECHFNSDAFGGGTFSSFDEINTEQGCEAQGGVWNIEQYQSGGVTHTDSWCEFNFGSGGNCDSSCWACENNASIVDDSTASYNCESSALGYCEYISDTNAPNTFGWCNPKQAFIDGGGKSCNDKCGSCDFLNSPEAECVSSFKGCTWINDSSAQNGIGNCYGKSEKYCANNCFSCYTSSDCTANGDGGSGACTWDNASFLCKTTGFNGEICFDGKDNDNDGNVDCADSNCATDKFCGGSDLSAAIGFDCPSLNAGVGNNETCIDAGCVWVIDEFEGNFGGDGGGHCDFPGAQCWTNDNNATNCNATNGCTFINVAGGFCFENHTLTDECFEVNVENTCDATYGCGWTNDTFSGFGRCEAVMFSECFANQTRHVNETNCIENGTVNGVSTQLCSWENNTFSPNGGFCNPVCFGLSNGECTEANTNGLCEVVVGICEPDSFGGKCFEADGNETRCTLDLNQTCSWFNDTTVDNNVSNPSEADGWCNPKGEAGFINFMGAIEPTILGTDSSETGLNESYDITDILIRDDFDKFVFGTKLLFNLRKSGICNGVPDFVGNPSGSGNLNHTFFWYLDTDGNTTNNCAARDNSSATGYEFSFKYQSNYGSSLVETKVSYRCVDGNWGPTPIPLSSNQQIMCDLLGGGMAGINKAEMFKFKSLFNKSKDLRVYATVNNVTDNDSNITDVAGPFYYSPGSVDFQFEDCANPGSDTDGDGLTASNDPDCFDFLKFGFVPQETGFQCGDEIDNDADGATDCDDDGCSFDTFFCGGSLTCTAGDNSAPKVKWLNVNTFPDSAFIMYDTNEPANGTIDFYGTNDTCSSINMTIRDVGIYDSFLPTHKLWHDGPLDNFEFNPEANSNLTLDNGTVYYYKTNVCDVCGNCAVSACLNFTTKASSANCKSCTSTFSFPFTPPTGASVTDPLGVLNFTIIQQNGSETALGSNSATGTQLNYSETKNFNLKVENLDSEESNWSITLVNASISGKISSGITNFSEDDGDIGHNGTLNGTFIGLGNTKCQELLNTFRPKKLHIGVPGNLTDLYQCNAGLLNCTKKNVGTNATSFGFNETTNVTIWEVPAEWGC